MLGPFEWNQTVRVLWNLAQFVPDMKQFSAPLVAMPAALEPYNAPGIYEIEVRDEAHFRATFPVGALNRPAIVFSGGGAEDPTGYGLIVRFWASHGFVVLQPLHSDAHTLHMREAKHPILGWRRTIWDVWGLALGENRMWRARCDDVSRLLDEIGDFQGRIDTQKIGAGGYSFGAHVASLLGGVRFDGRDGSFFAPDARIKAVLRVSGESGARWQRKSAWDRLKVPFLVITGSADRTVWGRDYRSKWEAFRRAPSPQKAMIEIAGANHFAFLGRLLESATHPADIAAQQRICDVVKTATLRFWQATLENQPHAWEGVTMASHVHPAHVPGEASSPIGIEKDQNALQASYSRSTETETQSSRSI